MSEEQTPGAHAQRCFDAAWRVAEQMGRIVGDSTLIGALIMRLLLPEFFAAFCQILNRL